jgi:hypothetical protein
LPILLLNFLPTLRCFQKFGMPGKKPNFAFLILHFPFVPGGGNDLVFFYDVQITSGTLPPCRDGFAIS